MSADAQPTANDPPAGIPPDGAPPAPRLDPDKDKLPLNAEGWADLKWVNEEYNRGAWDQYAGNSIAVARKQLIAFGPDLLALRERAAKERGLDPDRISITYVEPPMES